MINIKDANGKWVVIAEDDLMEAMASHRATILGMTIPVIGRLRQHYIEHGGPMPMTMENVESFMERRTPRPYKDDCDA